MTDYEYQIRYGIRLPDGSLAQSPYGQPWSWPDRETAERAIGYFRAGAERVGVHDWSGEIVRQLCSPWVGECDHARAQEFVDAITEWLEQQAGEQ